MLFTSNWYYCRHIYIYKPGDPLQILKRVVFHTIIASKQLNQDMGANAVLIHSRLFKYVPDSKLVVGGVRGVFPFCKNFLKNIILKPT